MKPLLITVTLLLGSFLTAAEPFTDPYTDTPVKERRASRGPWQIKDGVAQCTQDDNLYKEFANHGPILFYDLDYTDAEVRFAFRPDASAKSFVFTMNNADGHVFRFITSSKGTQLRAFPPSDDHKSIVLGSTGPTLVADQWTPVKITVQGTQVSVSIGDAFHESIDHPSFASPKSNLSLGFSFGTLAIQDLRVTRP